MTMLSVYQPHAPENQPHYPVKQSKRRMRPLAKKASASCQSIAPRSKQDPLFSDVSHHTATTVSTSESSFSSSDSVQQKSVSFNPVVRVRSHMSCKDLTPMAKNAYWGKVTSNEDRRTMLREVVQESSAEMPELVGVSYKMTESIASKSSAEKIRAIHQSPASFAKLLYHDDLIRGVEHYVSPGHRQERRVVIYRARSAVLKPKKNEAKDDDSIAARYAQRSASSSLLARLRGCADEIAVQEENSEGQREIHVYRSD